jgi:outer membrane protein assembly factor BamB
MTGNQGTPLPAAKPLRLRAGAILGALLALLWFVLPAILPGDVGMYAMFGALACAIGVVIWWLFFSRAPWIERLGIILFAALALMATRTVVHPSIAGGMMGFMPFVYGVPMLGLALVAGAVIGGRSAPVRRVAIAAAMLMVCGIFTTIRTGGISSTGSDLHWRWTPTPEDRLLAQTAAEKDPVPPPAAPAEVPAPAPATAPAAASASVTPAPVTALMPSATLPPAEWPGFRGPARDDAVHGVNIETDWSKSPPVEIWRRPIGPGWSSFAVQGNFIFTQEQRGDDEIVACYSLTTGAPVWRHRDKARFWESNAGAGPRATPTLSNGRVYTLGATGLLNALDARTGAVIWSRNAKTDTGAPLPGWGFAGSPLVVGDVVIAAVSGRLAGYNAATGTPRWKLETGGSGYSSPHLATIAGVTQVLFLSTAGATSVSPADGSVLWKHAWSIDGIVQPRIVDGTDVLVGSGSGLADGSGIRRLAIARHSGGGWTVEERWTSRGLKPYFNDFVVVKGHAYGFDGSILSCIDLADGTRKWKGGRYGQGQMIALADQDLLVVLSEEGDLALVKAVPDEFTELARFTAIEGKTWNHPVLVGNVLLVRNGEEMAAFRLAATKTQ